MIICFSDMYVMSRQSHFQATNNCLSGLVVNAICKDVNDVCTM